MPRRLSRALTAPTVRPRVRDLGFLTPSLTRVPSVSSSCVLQGLPPFSLPPLFFAIELLYRVKVIEYELLSLGLIQHDGVHRVFAPELLRYQAEAASLRRGKSGRLARGSCTCSSAPIPRSHRVITPERRLFIVSGSTLSFMRLVTCDILSGSSAGVSSRRALLSSANGARPSLCRLFALGPTVFYDAAQNIRNIIHAARYSDIV